MLQGQSVRGLNALGSKCSWGPSAPGSKCLWGLNVWEPFNQLVMEKLWNPRIEIPNFAPAKARLQKTCAFDIFRKEMLLCRYIFAK